MTRRELIELLKTVDFASTRFCEHIVLIKSRHFFYRGLCACGALCGFFQDHSLLT